MDFNNSELNKDNEYSIHEIYFILKKHYKLLIYFAIIFIFLGTYYTLIKKPIYSSTSTIMLNEDQASMSMLDMGLGKNRNYLKNEIQILQSFSTSESVVEKLLESEYKNDLYLLNTKKYEPPYYRKYLTLGLLDIFQNIQFFNSDKEKDVRLIRKYAKKLRSKTSIYNKRDTDALEITVVSHSPKEAVLLVNTIVDVYKHKDLEWATGEMSHLKSFLYTQINNKELELKNIENDLKNFQKKEKIFGLNINSEMRLNNLINIETEYNNILAQIKVTNEREKYINKVISDEEKDISYNISNALNDKLSVLKDKIASGQIELITTISEYGENHNAVPELKNEIKKLKEMISNQTSELILSKKSTSNPILYRQSLIDSLVVIQSLQSNLESKANEYKKLVDLYSDQLSDLPEKMLKYTQLQRLQSIHAETYSFMKKKLEESKIGEASKISKIRIIDIGVKNSKPIKPEKIRNIFISFLMGIFFGSFVIFIIEYFDNTIKSIEQIERRNLTVLSIIPDISKNVKNKNNPRYEKTNINDLQRRLITHENPKSPISEAYRSLRTSLMYSGSNLEKGVMLVSSSGPGEGKTTTIVNLAITYANLGKKVLLIDSDLRKPVVHNVFNINKSPGLTEFLVGNSNKNDIINKSSIENLSLISSGTIPPNPSELLNSPKMKKLIDDLKNDYDYILFDSPPLIAVTDAYVLLKHVTQFVLVIRAGITEKGGLERALSALKQAELNITGVVMNAMSEEHSYGAGYYYNYYQYYYGNDKNA